MSETAPTYEPGTPMWVDLGTPDVKASISFYSQLFGWQAEDMGEEAGHYHLFRQEGKMVAGGGPLMSPQQPTAWSTYVHTPDAATTAKSVRDAGGQVLVEPFPVMDQGVMAVFADPSGAVISVWQPQQHRGAELVNRPFGFCWNELQTRDLEAVKAFYPRVFNWGIRENNGPDGKVAYVEWLLNGRTIAGCMPMGDQIPAQVPPHWLVYFAVDDADATAQKAQQLGARMMMPPMDIPQGRFSVLTDPQGATFGEIRMRQ